MEGVLNGTYDYRCVIVHIVLGMDYSFSYRHWNLVLVGDHFDYILIYDNIHTFIPANYEGIQGRWSILPALCGSTPFSTTSPGCTSSVSLYWSWPLVFAAKERILSWPSTYSVPFTWLTWLLCSGSWSKLGRFVKHQTFICLRMKLGYSRHKRNHMYVVKNN